MYHPIYDGPDWPAEAWKHDHSSDATPPATRTRAAEQEHLDYEYCNARLSRDEWHRRTQELSEPTKWSASGRVNPK